MLEAQMEFVARYRQSDGTPQRLQEHLDGVAELAERFAAKVGLPKTANLAGRLHDLAKFGKGFQDYIKSSVGRLEPDDDDYIDPRKARGKIDHSTAGAQFVWRYRGKSPFQQLGANIMALCIASHHSGLIDCLAPDGTDVFSKRMDKADDKSHYSEAVALMDEATKNRAIEILLSPELETELKNRLTELKNIATSTETGQFALGFLTRFLFSRGYKIDCVNGENRLQSHFTGGADGHDRRTTRHFDERLQEVRRPDR
jgi:CRISPR-associated endonuclease/helicase Cas3